jgi:hypothetical protein
MSFALVLAEPRLPFRMRRMVGLLTFAFRASRSGRMPWARNHRSNGVSNFIGIGFTPLQAQSERTGGGWRRDAERDRSRSIIPRLGKWHEELQVCLSR